MGVQTLPELLKLAAGFDIVKGASLGSLHYGLRGINVSDEKIKVFINNHAINSPFDGSAINYVDNLSLRNVKKVEIIRGPGSALYGANAFLGIINIITNKCF